MTTFISYSRTDSDLAVRLGRDLKAAGLSIWLDQLDIPTGARWDDEIEQALEASSTMLIILSPESIKSQNVKDEVSYAIDGGKRILPVTVRECNIPLRLRRFQYVDFSNKSYEESLVDIKRLLGASSELSKEGHRDPSAFRLADRDGDKLSTQKSRRSSGNMPIVLLTVILLLAVVIVAGLFLLFNRPPATTSPTDPVAATEQPDLPAAITFSTEVVAEPSTKSVLSIRVPSLNETLPDIWIDNAIDVMNMPLPGTQIYSGSVNKNKEYLFRIRWCATSLNTLDENLQSITMKFVVNNEPVPDEYIGMQVDDSQPIWKCAYHSIVVGGWDANIQYTLEGTRILAQQIFDGESYFDAGAYTRKIILDVH